jgi:transcriptional regulator with XRE-family HTH domain
MTVCKANSLGRRVRGARKLTSLSAGALDGLAGLTRGHVNAIEAGRKANVEGKTAQKIARVLGVSLDWLINGEGDPPDAQVVIAAVERARATLAAGHKAS